MKMSSSSRNLAETLRGELDRYSPGEKLPSSRSLVERFGVSPVTVSQAIAALAAEGLLNTRPGAGAFRSQKSSGAGAVDTSWQQIALTAEDPERGIVDASTVTAALALPAHGVIAFNSGYLHSSLQPEQALGAAFARAARRPGAWGRPPLEGLPALRGWFAREVGGVTAAQVLIAPGGQAALNTALHALVPAGSPVLVESPTYHAALAAARAAGLRPVPVPMDHDGVRPELLEEAFDATGARAFYCQPLFHNPTGAVLSVERRRLVIEIAHRAGAFVIEDDYARRLGHGGPADARKLPSPLVADDAYGVVVHLSSLTKPTSPSLRVAALVARGPVMERLRAIQVVGSFFVPRPLQEATLDFVSAPTWNRHLRAASAALRERRDAMIAALHRELPELASGVRVPAGGYHLWLPLPDGTDEIALAAAAHRAGVTISPGRPYFAAEAPAPYVRVSFADTTGTDEIDEGVRRLAGALEG
jgi:DNA-binding transcriptional MocR family regulator